jgi:type II secretory pathway pseudopilin PulG
LIVVAILGILAAVIIPNVAGFMVTGRLNAANTEVENVKTGTLAYYAEYGAWPVAANWTILKNNFLAGNLGNGVLSYGFDPNYGWVLTADPATRVNGIIFSPGVAGATGSNGKWVR